MKKLLTALFLATSLCVMFTASAQAQSMEQQIDLARQAHQTDREALITMNVHFTSAEGEAFWPLYRQYAQLRKANGDMRLALIQEFAASYQTLTDEQANALLLKSYDIDEDLLDTKRQYALMFQEVLPGKKVAKIMQMESKLDTAINMKLAAEIPMVK